jgi:reductive dehalogenase
LIKKGRYPCAVNASDHVRCVLSAAGSKADSTEDNLKGMVVVDLLEKYSALRHRGLLSGRSAGRFSPILEGRASLSRLPERSIPRVANITTDVSGTIERIDALTTGYMMAGSGAWGPTVQRESARSCNKTPLGYADTEVVGMVFPAVRDGDVHPHTAPIPSDPRILSNHIKSLGYFLSADIVGICELPQWTVYARDLWRDPVVCDHKYAILLVSQWDYETFDASTGDDWISLSESFLAYNRTAMMACEIAGYIRRLGYPARAHFQAGDESVPSWDVIFTPLLVQAGIGELSRAGWALNPYLGGRFKAAVVTTDLPLLPDKPIDFGLQAYCETCKRCAKECPSRAISDSDHRVVRNGYSRFEFEMERCTKYRLMNQNGAYCGRCVKVCPWNKPKGRWHDIVRLAIRNTPPLNPMWVKLDEWWGYGKQHPALKWWFDLEEVDGRHRVPPRSLENSLWQIQEAATDAEDG